MKDQAPILESEELYQDHLFNVQCDDLITESRCKVSRKAEAYRNRLVEILEQHVGVELSDITIPSLKKASNAHVLPTFITTILLDGFGETDYKHVYFEKRDKLITKVANLLGKRDYQKDLGTIYWRHEGCDPHKKCLLLIPDYSTITTTTTKFRFLLVFRMKHSDWIPMPRLLPNRVNGTTPWYNHGLTEDIVVLTNSFADPYYYPDYLDKACVILQIWALQNGHLRSSVQVSDIQQVLLYLHRTRAINPRFSMLNILSSVFKFLSSKQRVLCVMPLLDRTESQTIRECELNRLYDQLTRESPLTNNDPPSLLECHAGSPFVLLDSSMRHNLLGRWPPSIRYCAQQALETLRTRDAFEKLFGTNRRFWNAFDVYIRVPKDSNIQRLEYGLGNRIIHTDVLRPGNGDPKDSDSPVHDSDEIPTFEWGKTAPEKEDHSMVIGLCIHPDHSRRIVDRCLDKDSKAFCEFWGTKAELRRFQDGAIVNACVWEDKLYHNEDISIVAQIVKHLCPEAEFALRNMHSVVDGLVNDKQNSFFTNALHAHRNILKAYESLSTQLRQPTTLPLTIDAVEPLSPALRYATLYPPIPHPLLLGNAAQTASAPQKCGAILSDPISIQIRFGASSKWPTELKSIGAAKTAMLLELVKSLQATDQFGKGSIVTPDYADVCYRGYVFRIFVRADPELRLLRSLQKPTDEASAILAKLTKESVVAATHHTLTHAVYTSHPSSSGTVRLVQRWLSSHLLSDQIPFEAVELIVAYIYKEFSPGTVIRGFLRFLHLLATYNWADKPMVADPQGHLKDSDYRTIQSQFETARGSNNSGPAMYIVSPCTYSNQEDDGSDKILAPVFTANYPEPVILARAVALASRTHSFLTKTLKEFDISGWHAVFQENAEAFHSYSALLRVDPAFLFNMECSSTTKDLGIVKGKDGAPQTSYTRSMMSLADGPKGLRRQMYRNLTSNDDEQNGILLAWRPVQAAMEVLRDKLGHCALFLYNEHCPEVIGVVWRPKEQAPFSAVSAEFTRPVVTEQWKNDTLVALNVQEILREALHLISDCINNVKCFDHGYEPQPPSKKLKQEN